VGFGERERDSAPLSSSSSSSSYFPPLLSVCIAPPAEVQLKQLLESSDSQCSTILTHLEPCTMSCHFNQAAPPPPHPPPPSFSQFSLSYFSLCHVTCACFELSGGSCCVRTQETWGGLFTAQVPGNSLGRGSEDIKSHGSKYIWCVFLYIIVLLWF